MATPEPTKIDLLKEHRGEYVKPKKPVLIDTTPASYLAVDGTGGPGGELFTDRIGALYGMAFTIKFRAKFAGRDFAVCKLEALYGVGGQVAADFAKLPQEEWNWRMLIRVPDFINDADLEAARAALREKQKPGDFDAVHLATIEEGPCVQVLHVGPYEEEERTVALIDAFCAEEGLKSHLWHHEIYLSDPRRIPPDRLKTIIRHPVTRG